MNILKQFSFFALLALLGLSSTYATTNDVEFEEKVDYLHDTNGLERIPYRMAHITKNPFPNNNIGSGLGYSVGPSRYTSGPINHQAKNTDSGLWEKICQVTYSTLRDGLKGPEPSISSVSSLGRLDGLMPPLNFTEHEVWVILQAINKGGMMIEKGRLKVHVEENIMIGSKGWYIQAGDYVCQDRCLLLPYGSYGYNNVVSSKMHQYSLTTLLTTLFIGLCSGGALGLYAFKSKHRAKGKDVAVDEIDAL